MSSSLNPLSNIKTIQESDEEGDYNAQALIEALSEFPNAIAETAEATFEEDNSTTEQEDSKLDCIVDPLLENVQVVYTEPFNGDYNERDFINECSDEDVKPPKSKRARCIESYSAPSGVVWSIVKPSSDTFDLDSFQQWQPQGKGPARDVSSPLEAWQLLIDERMLTQVVNLTNAAIRRPKQAGKAHGGPTDLIEMRGWLGLNYLCGIFRNHANNGPLDELWTWELGNSIFRATMSFKRFEFLSNCLRCSEPVKTLKKGVPMEYAPAHKLWQSFMINCRSYYAPSGNCTIGEHQMNGGGKNRMGVKLLSLHDAKTGYMCNAMVTSDYVSKNQEILGLVGDLKGSKRNVVLNEEYTSMELANLLHARQLSTVGKLNVNAPDVPSEWRAAGSKPQKLYAEAATLNWCEEGTSCTLTRGLSTRINAKKMYQLSSDACQGFYEAAGTYSTRYAQPPSNDRWLLSFFHQLLDYAAANAWILLRLSAKGNFSCPQRKFQRDLGLYLTQLQLRRQLKSKKKLTLPQRLQVSEVLGEDIDKLLADAVSTAGGGSVVLSNTGLPEGVTLQSKHLETRVRCRKCRGIRGCVTRTRCQQCLRPMCYRYLYTRCCDCMGLPPIEPPVKQDTEQPSIG